MWEAFMTQAGICLISQVLHWEWGFKVVMCGLINMTLTAVMGGSWEQAKSSFVTGFILGDGFEYDAAGNRISKETSVKGDISTLADIDLEEVQVTEGTTVYTYNALNQLVTEASPEGNIIYTYDANGNLVKQTGSKTADYVYDKENQLTKATIRQGWKGNGILYERRRASLHGKGRGSMLLSV